MLSVITTAVLDRSRYFSYICYYFIMWGMEGLARTISCQIGFIGEGVVNRTNRASPLMPFSDKKGLRLKLHCMHARNNLNCKLSCWIFYMLHSPPFCIKFTCKIATNYYHEFISRVENRVDPDQLASEKPADLGQHCFLNRIYWCLVWKELIFPFSLGELRVNFFIKASKQLLAINKLQTTAEINPWHKTVEINNTLCSSSI